MSYMYFREEKVDVAVVETGIGGRLDATNIVDSLVSVITSVGYDHCEILGSTLNEIAFEKSGIIKPGRPVVLGSELPRDYLSVIARNKNAKVYSADGTSNFQEAHNNILKKIVHVLSTECRFNVPAAAIKHATACRQKCRMEYVDKKMIKDALGCRGSVCNVILDAGHNKSALVLRCEKYRNQL
eukprot:TRINITY_DN9730_c0_g1_i3.p1 TRINITY_DN9730_c0_g1~~TRINITY_DN9730_c0_g1_i3.p1  ORF type:complete len:184 (+),score=33.34 TRINITY_DN9730_c0_g1_i3:475-1026(+)